MTGRIKTGFNKQPQNTSQVYLSQYTSQVDNSKYGLIKSVAGSILFGLMISLTACGWPNKADSAPESKDSAFENISATPAVDSLDTPAKTDTDPLNPQNDAISNDTIHPIKADNHHNHNSGSVLQGVTATVYKDANCGCCTKWISYANKAGLQSTYQHPETLNVVKNRYGVPEQLRSCHTTVTTDGYVFEGHIPAKFIAQFIANPPSEAIGLAVPSMPVGSPGMEFEGKFMPYEVFVIHKDGSYEVFASVDSPEQQV